MSRVTAERLLQDPSGQGTGSRADGPAFEPPPGGAEPESLSAL